MSKMSKELREKFEGACVHAYDVASGIVGEGAVTDH